MPAPSTTKLASGGSKAQPYIMIPGAKRPTSRRVASNHATGIRAMVIPDKMNHSETLLKVSLMRERRVLYCTLKGHQAPIVDVEFLKTASATPVHVLGSCDRDGVVFLWFLYVAVDKLGIDVRLDLLKKYSFFTLRRSTTAFYSRIRLAGTLENGTMVLVPNDGANVRVVSFYCEPIPPNGNDGSTPLITASADDDPSGDGNGGHPQIEPNPDASQPYQPPALPPPPSNGDSQHQYQGNTTSHSMGEDLEPQSHELPFPSNQRTAVGLDDLAARSATVAGMTFESSTQPGNDEQGVSSRSTMNSSVAQARADVGAGTDDLPSNDAGVVGEGVQMEGALTPIGQLTGHHVEVVAPSSDQLRSHEDVIADDEEAIDIEHDNLIDNLNINDDSVDLAQQDEQATDYDAEVEEAAPAVYQDPNADVLVDQHQQAIEQGDGFYVDSVPHHQSSGAAPHDLDYSAQHVATSEYQHHYQTDDYAVHQHQHQQPLGLTDALIVEGEGLSGFNRA